MANQISSSLNIELPDLPQADSFQDTVVFDEVSKLYKAIHILHTDITNRTRITCVFDQTVTQGQAINLYSPTGILTARLANATVVGKQCVGFATYPVTAGNSGEVQIIGLNIALSGLTPGTLYYLNTVDGTITATAPAVVGNIVQPVGYAMNATTLLYNPSQLWRVV